MSWARELTQLAKVAAISAGVTCFVVNELGLIAKVEGPSMQPTFNPDCGRTPEYISKYKNLTRQEITDELRYEANKTALYWIKFQLEGTKQNFELAMLLY